MPATIAASVAGHPGADVTRTRQNSMWDAYHGTFASRAKLKPRFSAFSLPPNGQRADFEQACGAWYAAGWMANESDQWALDTNDVARRIELAAGSDEFVRLTAQR